MRRKVAPHHRKSYRLKGYDYSKPGFYFITICTRNMEYLFGDIIQNTMVLNEGGIIVRECWNAIPTHYPKVVLHEYIIMPNHIHGILEISAQGLSDAVGVQNLEPLQHQIIQANQQIDLGRYGKNKEPRMHKFQHIIPGSIGSIIRGFEIGVTKWFRANTDIYTVWQRNFHDSIIRSPKSIYRITRYIKNNPKNWSRDEFNSKA